MDERGKVVASGAEEHTPFASPQLGWAEQDPRDWWRACTLAVRRALNDLVAGGDLHGVSCAIGFAVEQHIEPGGVAEPETVLRGNLFHVLQIGA